jgi:hypothetical protein
MPQRHGQTAASRTSPETEQGLTASFAKRRPAMTECTIVGDACVWSIARSWAGFSSFSNGCLMIAMTVTRAFPEVTIAVRMAAVAMVRDIGTAECQMTEKGRVPPTALAGGHGSTMWTCMRHRSANCRRSLGLALDRSMSPTPSQPTFVPSLRKCQKSRTA